jgi:hypothetical protein
MSSPPPRLTPADLCCSHSEKPRREPAASFLDPGKQDRSLGFDFWVWTSVSSSARKKAGGSTAEKKIEKCERALRSSSLAKRSDGRLGNRYGGQYQIAWAVSISVGIGNSPGLRPQSLMGTRRAIPGGGRYEEQGAFGAGAARDDTAIA